MTSYLEQDALAVYLSQPGQTVNKGTDLSPWLTPLEISRTSGGRQLDYVVFDYNLGYTGEHIENLNTPLDWVREVEIWALINFVPTPIFWGDLVTQNVEISREERVTVMAKIMPYHFGDVAEGVTIPNYLQDPVEHVKSRSDIEFNPLVDGQIINNRADEKGDGGSQTDTHYLWLDPESIRSNTAENFNNNNNTTGFAEAWDLEEALTSLCWELNPSEEFVKNPSLIGETIFDDAPEVRNVSFKRGMHLPDYLDALLLPLGYDWYVSLKDDSGKIERRIKIFKRADGTEKTLKIAPFGEAADFATTDLESAVVTTDIGATVNKIIAHGAVQRREITVELYRGWPEANDNTSLTDLSYENDLFDKPNAWRRFIANEAGDYNGLRTTTQPIPSEPLDLSSVFDDYIPRRRKFMRPLTNDVDGEPLDIYVEYYDGTSWNPLPDEHLGEVRVLDTELGIFFAGAFPPKLIYDIGDDLKIRVTGTVVGDKPLTYEAEDTTESPNGRTVTLFLDLSDRFFDSQVIETGTYKSQLFVLNGTDRREQDDTDEIETYVDDLLAVEKSSVMDCDFTLMGLNANYGIGDIITKIEGREINLDRNAILAATPRYPQIIGVVYLPQSAQTRLLVDTNRGL